MPRILARHVIAKLPYTIEQQARAALNVWANKKCSQFQIFQAEDTTALFFNYDESRDKVAIQKALKQFLSRAGCDVTRLGLAQDAAWLEMMSATQFRERIREMQEEETTQEPGSDPDGEASPGNTSGSLSDVQTHTTGQVAQEEEEKTMQEPGSNDDSSSDDETHNMLCMCCPA